MKTSQYHIDILTAHFVQHPDWFDVVVGSNLFGDILSDLGPACTGTIGIAPVGEPESRARVPVVLRAGARQRARHRGKGIANPDRPDLVGRDDARAPRATRTRPTRSCAAIETVLKDGPRTRDMGGTANTVEVGKAIAASTLEENEETNEAT